MGTFAETSIVDYLYLLPTKANKRCVFRFRLQQQTKICRFHCPFAENKRDLPFSVFGIPKTYRHRHGAGDMKMET
jgi:hypothetical protein